MAGYDPKNPVKTYTHLSHVKTDPIRNFKYVVNLNHEIRRADGTLGNIGFSMGFMSVSGFSATTAPIPYRHGGQNTTPSMLPGQTSFTPISCSRGVWIGSSQTWQWFKEIFSVTVGGGNYVDNHGRAFRCDVDVLVLPHPRTVGVEFAPVAAWRLYNAWPTTLSYSDLNSGDNAFIVENMVLAHEGFEFNPQV